MKEIDAGNEEVCSVGRGAENEGMIEHRQRKMKEGSEGNCHTRRWDRDKEVVQDLRVWKRCRERRDD